MIYYWLFNGYLPHWMHLKESSNLVCLDRRTVGILLLIAVNILWVLSSELTRYIFVDEQFERPFFTVYIKSCTLIVYMIRYLMSEAEDENSYKVLAECSDTESLEMSCESLSLEGFESITEDSDVESFIEGENGKKKKTIRFSDRKEIRRMPSSNAEEQRKARLPYRHPSFECQFNSLPKNVKYTIFFFAPLWLICSFTYQTALMFTSVSSLNLISSSSSVFVLAFSICFPSPTNRFTLYKCILVATNIAGVLLVSHYMPSLMGAFFAQISSVSYAVYLFAFHYFENKYGKISINLMFGTIGVLCIIVGTPILNLLDFLKIEQIHPMPNFVQLSSIIASALFGTLLADYLWLFAASMCDSLTVALSMTISIPLSFLGDTVIRGKPPQINEIFASIPILLAFIGSAYSQSDNNTQLLRNTKSFIRLKHFDNSLGDNENLIEENE